MPNIRSKKLVEKFESTFSNSATYRRIGELANPVHIVFDGVEYYIYIKNVSSAHFDNPDVWRAQMTEREELQSIKDSDAVFILLGYDDTNDVYATWNPHQLKQRIGTAKSPSLYSRYSIQEEAARSGSFVKKMLNNDQEVLVFRREQIVDFLVNLDQFFPDTSEYVAMGSKRRTDANNAYKELVSPKRISAFEHYLLADTSDEELAHSYAKAMRQLVNDNYISKNRKIFLACDSLTEYMSAYKTFLELDEIKALDEENNHLFTDALESYILFLQEEDEPDDTDDEEEQDENPVEVHEDENTNESIEEQEEVEEDNQDWEAMFTDSYGNLTRIANPELLELLKPDLLSEYQSLPAAYNTILEFYGEDRFPNMQMKDWNNLFKTINWEDPAGIKERQAQEKKKKKTKILRIVLPNGETIMHRNVSTTFVQAIEMADPSVVKALNLVINGQDLVAESQQEELSSVQHPTFDGNYVLTHSSTDKKKEILEIISKTLGLGWQIDEVPVEDIQESHLTASSSERVKAKRNKLWVQTPDGEILNDNQVQKTFVRAIEKVGPELVRSFNIQYLGDNLVTETFNENYAKSMKPVSGGYYVNTNSSTGKKYEQLKEINQHLEKIDHKLTLVIHLV